MNKTETLLTLLLFWAVVNVTLQIKLYQNPNVDLDHCLDWVQIQNGHEPQKNIFSDLAISSGLQFPHYAMHS